MSVLPDPNEAFAVNPKADEPTLAAIKAIAMQLLAALPAGREAPRKHVVATWTVVCEIDPDTPPDRVAVLIKPIVDEVREKNPTAYVVLELPVAVAHAIRVCDKTRAVRAVAVFHPFPSEGPPRIVTRFYVAGV